ANGTTPGELYELNSAFPVPVVAAVTIGDLWPMVLVRGVAQLLAGLADEYELPGTQFEQPPAGALLEPPNVIMLDSAQSTALAGGAKAQTVIPDLVKRWPVHKQDTLTYHPNPGTVGQPSPPHPAGGGVQLVE